MYSVGCEGHATTSAIAKHPFTAAGASFNPQVQCPLDLILPLSRSRPFRPACRQVRAQSCQPAELHMWQSFSYEKLDPAWPNPTHTATCRLA